MYAHLLLSKNTTKYGSSQETLLTDVPFFSFSLLVISILSTFTSFGASVPQAPLQTTTSPNYNNFSMPTLYHVIEYTTNTLNDVLGIFYKKSLRESLSF